MSNWPLTPATRFEYLGAGTGIGTLLTSGGANTKGSFATIGTTAFAWSSFVLSINLPGNNSRFRIDIAVNSGGSDQIIVEDLFIESGVSTVQPFVFTIPVAVPAGAVVKARIQADAASRTLGVVVCGYAADFSGAPGASRLISLTDWTNTLPTNSVTQTGTSFSAWAQIMASTPRRVSALFIAPTAYGDTTRTASEFLVEIGKGGAGAEVPIGAFIYRQGAGGMVGLNSSFPCDLPAASRLAFRVQCAAAAADSLGISASGLAA